MHVQSVSLLIALSLSCIPILKIKQQFVGLPRISVRLAAADQRLTNNSGGGEAIRPADECYPSGKVSDNAVVTYKLSHGYCSSHTSTSTSRHHGSHIFSQHHDGFHDKRPCHECLCHHRQPIVLASRRLSFVLSQHHSGCHGHTHCHCLGSCKLSGKPHGCHIILDPSCDARFCESVAEISETLMISLIYCSSTSTDIKQKCNTK